MNLLLLLIIPLITASAVLIVRNNNQIRWVSFIGAAIQLCLAVGLFSAYKTARENGQINQMLFQQQYNWFPSWHINFHIGVDGISVAMILLTAFVVIAGVLISWNQEKMTKEFYFIAIIKFWSLWFFYFVRCFYFIFLFRNSRYS